MANGNDDQLGDTDILQFQMKLGDTDILQLQMTGNTLQLQVHESEASSDELNKAQSLSNSTPLQFKK